MRIHIRYFAALREAAGRDEETLDVADGALVGVVRDLLSTRHEALSLLLPRCAVAVNKAYAGLDTALRDGDELAFLPPVGGG